MSGYENEPARQERAVYLHEAGHAVAAIYYKKTIIEVFCDGKTGYVEATDSEQILAMRQAIRTAYSKATDEQKMSLVGDAWDAYEGEYVSRIAGFAGENLELGRPLTSFARGADDLTLLFIQVLPWLGPYSNEERYTLASGFVVKLLEKANAIILSKKMHVLAIADALKTKNSLSMSDIDDLLIKSESISK